MRALLMACVFAAGIGTGYGGPIAYRWWQPPAVAVASIPAAPLIHPARPVSWWKVHSRPELAAMIPWCANNDPSGHRFQDCVNAREAKSQLDIEAMIARAR